MRHGSEGDFMPMNDFYMRRHGRPDEFMDMFDSRGDRFSDRFNESGMGGNDMDRMMRYMRNSMSREHFTESEAKYLVADMYHTENGRKYSGEKFDMYKAKEICERYRGYSLHLLQLLMCMLQSTLSTMTMQNCLRTGLVMV